MTMGVAVSSNGDQALTAAAVPLSRVVRKLLERLRAELAHGELGAAERTLAAAVALAPAHVEVIRCMGQVAQQQGDYATVIDCYGRALAVWPADAQLHLGLGAALFASGVVVAGIDHLQRAAQLTPDAAEVWLNLGEALKQAARGKEAVAALARAAQLDAESIPIHLALARAHASLGDKDAAAQAYQAVLHLDPANPVAWFGLSSLNTYRFDAQAALHLREYFAAAGQASNARELLGYTFAKALEDQGDYAAAFDVFQAANGLQRAHCHWDAATAHRRVEATREAFTRREPLRRARATAGREIIFIASLPRSGSSLVEQILASHPEVEGANEISALSDVVDLESQRRHEAFPGWVPFVTPADWQRMGADYLARTARWRTLRPRCTDKNLAAWHLAGAALTMLPGARVVVVRRDPLETCLACFRQRLQGDAGFTCDLDAMASYCIDFMRLTRFWLERFPDRVLDLSYEAMLAAPEPTVRRLLAFCDLGFDPACIQFQRTERSVLSAPSAAQVREPLQRDTARADRYGAKLDDLRAKLLAGGLQLRGTAADEGGSLPH